MFRLECGNHSCHEPEQSLNIPNPLSSIWRDDFILSSSSQPTSIKDIRPTTADHGVIDPKTYDVIEVDALFKAVNHTQTSMGNLVLYRALSRPITDANVLQQKQDALRELESNPTLHRALQRLIDDSMLGEESLNHLLYGEFIGGLATDEPIDGSHKLEFGGYGYNQYKDGTEFVVALVKTVDELPPSESAYLNELFKAIRDFGQSHTYALMRGPVYPTGGKFKTQDEKTSLAPAFRFQPSMFKPLPLLIFIAAIYGIDYAFSTMLPELGASYIGYGLLALAVPAFPVIMLTMSISDRDSIIYPLRQQFRHSPELAKALEALGMIDELLSHQKYAQSCTGKMVLPEIISNKYHQLNVHNASNPLLQQTMPNYVPNDISLKNSDRLLIITGPNSGGKTAYCKTVAQIQLLGQAGCYVPASSAQLVPVDHIFYQVPDPSRLDAGIGRFGHELQRTREIFFNSTPLSLVILDELSEGTTFEEKMTLSEYILKGFKELGASTLLVTHNHELCDRLQDEAIGQYLQVEFAEQGPTHQMITGISRDSHADHVATKIGFSKKDVEKHLATRNQSTNDAQLDNS